MSSSQWGVLISFTTHKDIALRKSRAFLSGSGRFSKPLDPIRRPCIKSVVKEGSALLCFLFRA